jgi:DNA-binding NtrC family response regulator
VESSGGRNFCLEGKEVSAGASKEGKQFPVSVSGARIHNDALELGSHEKSIDVLLTDVVIPGLRGTELANEVQKLHEETHVIYISGNAQNLRYAQIPSGAALLQKPFRLATLAEQLKLVPRKV